MHLNTKQKNFIKWVYVNTTLTNESTTILSRVHNHNEYQKEDIAFLNNMRVIHLVEYSKYLNSKR